MNSNLNLKTLFLYRANEFSKAAFFFLVTLAIGNAWAAVDETAVANIDHKASTANGKADSNNSRIQDLESEDIILHQRIDSIELTPGPTGPQGEQGPIGLTGDRGPQGLDGSSGLNCWDSNGNHAQDVDEDINGDGIFNALDCISSVDLTELIKKLDYVEARLQNGDIDGDGFTPATGDCNDARSDINPDAYEINDGIDNNCDGILDGIVQTDADQDGFVSIETGGTDCDDNNPQVFPGQTSFFAEPYWKNIEVGITFDYDCNGEEEKQYVDFGWYEGDYERRIILGRDPFCTIKRSGWITDYAGPDCGVNGELITSPVGTYTPSFCEDHTIETVQSCR